MTPVALEVERAVTEVVKAARGAARRLATATTSDKNTALGEMARLLQQERAAILEANRRDAATARAAGESVAFLDRLTLTDARFLEMVASVDAVRALPDPVGRVLRSWTQPNGLRIEKISVPLGVIGIIYESRPNVTSDCASLCLKSGNAVILRGGSEAFRSNQAIAAALQQAVALAGLPAAAIGFIPTAERAGVDVLLRMDEDVNAIIPRGGEALIRKIVEQSRIPVIKHAKGVCHVYVDAKADLAMAARIAVNAKCQRPGTCNAMETLLVHERVAARFLPDVLARLQQARVEVRGDEATRAIVPDLKAATEEDWSTEYLDLILSVKVVPSVEAAVDHIARYGSAHSDAIVTEDAAAAEAFVRGVDSAAVYVNASTRFTDGFQFGLGAEIGISTDRLHARGPMGLEELTTYKYVVRGTGQLRE